MLGAIPAEAIFTVPFDPDYYTDRTWHRKVHGEGEFDLAGFLRLVGEIGVRLPLSVKVMSVDREPRPAGEVARRPAEAARGRGSGRGGGLNRGDAMSVEDELAIRALVARYALRPLDTGFSNASPKVF